MVWQFGQNNNGNTNDDVSLLGQGSAPGGTNTRHVYQLVPAMPPAPSNNTTSQPPRQQQHDGSTRSTNAGSAFNR